MNRLAIIKLVFQILFVTNCIFMYGFLMLNNESQVREIKQRHSGLKQTCYIPKPLTSKRRVENLLDLTPPDLDKSYKNPCFTETCSTGNRTETVVRCLPFFHILGVDKSGTTDLFQRILQHPQVLGNGGSLNKETMWWSWKRYGLWLSKYSHQKESFRDYLAYFDSSAKLITNESDTMAKQLVIGDGTPMDFWDFSGWPDIDQNKGGLTMPKVLTPHLMHHINPNVKFILLFRNPADRLYSDYMFIKHGGVRTSKGFHDAVGFSINYLKNCARNHTLEQCLFYRKVIAVFKARIHIGFYSVFLKQWLKVFDRKQFLILRSEDYNHSIKDTLQEVFKFLQLDDLSEQELVNISKLPRAHKTELKKKQGPMHKKTIEILNKLYKPYNEGLAKMLNDTRFLWENSKK